MEVISYSAELLSFLFVVAVVAGFLDTLAGGGGLIAIPALMMSGVPPLAALGTNKLQGSMGTATSTFMLVRKKKISLKENRQLIFSAFLGASTGSVAVQFIDASVLSFVIPVILGFIAVYFLVSPKPKSTAGTPSVSDRNYRNYVVAPIGFYDGMFGPGTGSFFALAGVSGRGYGLVDSTAVAKSLNFSTNIASLIVFLAAGHIVWAIGLLMMLGQVIGAWLGSHFLYRINPLYLRGLVVLMCTGMLIRYCFSMGWFEFA